MSSNYSVNVSESVKKLFMDNIIDKDAAESFGKGSRTILAPDLDEVEYDPVFTCIIMDKSGSMHCCQQAVVDAQNAMIDALRDSAITRHGAHFILQYQFDEKLLPIHDAEALATARGNDNVALLTLDMYRPGGQTALYKSVHMVLQDMMGLLSKARDQGMNAKFVIVLVSDGADNECGIKPEDIRNLVKQLQEQGILKTSIIVGLLNPQFNEKQLENIRKNIGFEKSLVCDQSSPRKIRETFVMASQSAVARTQL